MLRRLITSAALAATFAFVAPVASFAQPPSPPAVVHKVDRGVRRIVTNVDRKVHHTRRSHHVVRHSARRVSYRYVRARCNDGRVHTGRTSTTACASYGGIR